MSKPVILLDGALGAMLKQRGVVDMRFGLRAQYLARSVAPVEKPGMVEEVHEEYIKAGVDVVTTGNYDTTRHHLRKLGQAHRLEEITKAAAVCARRVVQRSGKSIRVAGSLPPLKMSYVMNPDEEEGIKDEYMTIAKVLAPHVDFLLCETLSCIREAVPAAEAARSTGLPVWVSFSLEDSLDVVLRSKEPLMEALHRVWDGGPVEAFLLNCCCPEAIAAAIPVLQEFVRGGQNNKICIINQLLAQGVSEDVPPMIGVYPNAFQLTTTEWMAGASKPSLTNPDIHGEDGFITPEGYCQLAQDWVKSSVQIIGGCCGVTPEHIQALREGPLSSH